ncbi:Hpt domain-containing protein [Patescibacteria group bacterium]|nr:Hpt domain-containing protein [Patescibacteria group bacterium]
MDSLGIDDYKPLFLQTARKNLERIRDLLGHSSDDTYELYRLFHTVKGQSLFMGFKEIGEKALQCEITLRSIIDRQQLLSAEQKNDLAKSVDFIFDQLKRI